MTDRAYEVLQALRRTAVSDSDVEDALATLMNDVHPTAKELLAAAVEAQRLPNADPQKNRLLALLRSAADSGLFCGA
jgi:hypothetical protein